MRHKPETLTAHRRLYFQAGRQRRAVLDGMTCVSQKCDTPLRPFWKWIVIEQRPLERLVNRAKDRRNLRMPPLIVFCGIGDRTAVRPLFSCPARLFAHRYKVQKSAGGNVVVDKMYVWPHPVCDIKCKVEMGDAFSGSKPPIRDLPREPCLFFAEKPLANSGMYFVRPDKEIATLGRAILKVGGHASFVLLDIEQTSSKLDLLGTERFERLCTRPA
jgi:hypothetical protein